jgi:CheY-like chemotaxis protein
MVVSPLETSRGDAEGERLKGVTVLVVEDDDDSRELLSELLGGLGATCVPASSGNQARALFLKNPPDIVVSDLWMPDGDGFELARRIRSLPPEQGGLIPAIAVSAASNTEEALMAGYHVLIGKPYDPFEIVQAIEEFLRTDHEVPSLHAPWTVSSPATGAVVATFDGYVRVSDIRACMGVLVRHLQRQDCEVVLDFRRLTGFSLAAASVAERIVWPMRHAVLHVRIVGGPKAARLVSVGACRVLGLSYRVENG